MPGRSEPSSELNELSHEVIGAAIRVHRELGPGLLESAYRDSLVHVLEEEGIGVSKEVAVPARFEGEELDASYRIDLLVEGEIVLELKVCEEIHPVHKAQLRTYLEVTGSRLGLLLNFYVAKLVDGIHRIIR